MIPCLAHVLGVPFLKVQSRRLLAELLLQTSQLRPKDQVVIIAATNRMGELFREVNASDVLTETASPSTYQHNRMVEKMF